MAEAPSEGGELAGDAPDLSVSRSILNPRGMRCLLCAYDLSGIPSTACCPECAAEIAHTRRLLLSSQPARTLRRLQRGAVVLLIGVGVQAVFGGVGNIAPAILLMRSAGGVNVAALVALTAALSLFGIAIHATVALGHWGVTTPLSGEAPAEWSRNTTRVSIRVLTIGLLVLAVASLAMGLHFMLDPRTAAAFGSSPSSAPPTLMSGVGMGLMIGLGVLTALCEFARFLLSAMYLGALARRVPDPGTVKIARGVVRFSLILVICMIILGIVVACGLLLASGLLSPGAAAAIIGVCFFGGVLVVSLSTLTLFVFWIVGYAKFASALSQVRKEAAGIQQTQPVLAGVNPA